MATPIRTRPPAVCIRSIPWRMFSSVFEPNPFRPCSRPPSIASASSSTEATPISSYSTIAFFGPRPGMAISWRTPAGTRARSCSTAAISPVRRYSSTFSAVDLPTLGISSRPFRSSVETSAWYPPIDLAAFS